MDPIIGGALISAGANLLGGLLGRKSNKSTVDQNVAQQREFAQKGIQWKVADAKAAGIHPVYALGANTVGFSPISVSDPMPQSLSNMGQDVSRAMYATADGYTRRSAQLSALQLEHIGLQNDLLRSQIAKLNAQVGPPGVGVQSFPVGSGDVITRDIVEVKPSEITSARSGDPSVAAGPAGPAYAERDFGPLGKWNILAGDVSESLDDLEIAKYAALAGGNLDKIKRLLQYYPPMIVYNWVRNGGGQKIDAELNRLRRSVEAGLREYGDWRRANAARKRVN